MYKQLAWISYFSFKNMHVGMKRSFSEWSSVILAVYIIGKRWCKYMTITFDLKTVNDFIEISTEVA